MNYITMMSKSFNDETRDFMRSDNIKLAGFMQGIGTALSNFAANPGKTTAQSYKEMWHPPGDQSAWSTGFSRAFGVGFPALDLYRMGSNPGGTTFEDVGNFAGGQLATAMVPTSMMGRIGIMPTMALGLGTTVLGGAIGRGLDKLTGRGRQAKMHNMAASGQPMPGSPAQNKNYAAPVN